MPIEEKPEGQDPQGLGLGQRANLLARQAELNASPGYRALRLMDYVRRIGYVFQANVGQLKVFVAAVQDPSASSQFFDVQTPESHDDLLNEVERLLHNVLMALSTRIDQQRGFMRRNFSEDAEFLDEYAARVAADFGPFAPGVFLRDLRNYLTHYQLPMSQSQQTFTQKTFEVRFGLLPGPLKDWGSWKPVSRTWLSEQDDDIDIAELIDGYARIAGSFDKWFHDAIGDRNRDDIGEYQRAADVFNADLDRVFGN